MIDIAAWFDVCIIALVVILGIKGLLSGFIKEIFGLLGLIGGLVIASRNANLVGEFISQNLYELNDTTNYFIGFLAALVVFWVVCLVAGNLLSKMISFSGLKFLDMILGFFVGSAKIFLVFAIFVAIIANIQVLQKKVEPYTEQSIVYPLLLQSGRFIMNINLEQVQTDLQNNLNTETNSSIAEQIYENNTSNQKE